MVLACRRVRLEPSTEEKKGHYGGRTTCKQQTIVRKKKKGEKEKEKASPTMAVSAAGMGYVV